VTSTHPNARPFDSERALWARCRAQAEEAFGMEEEASSPFGSRDAARELAYQALEAENRREASSLAQRALAMDGECTDAQVVLARVELPSPRALAKQLRLVVERAGARLGAPFLQQHRGDLWGFVEARPYLRARMALAEAAEKASRPLEAILHLEGLLAQDPQDHLKARIPLVRCYLASGKLKPLDALLNRDPASPFLAWATILAHLKDKNEKAARKALEYARQLNPNVEDFLTGRQKRPRKITPPGLPGSPDEAVVTLALFGELWNNDREAIYWLFKQG